MKTKKTKNIIIIGAGPAGIATAYTLLDNNTYRNDLSIKTIDKNDIVGGLARTHNYKGYLFDVGPHRFYTKNVEVLDLWKKIIGKDLLKVDRLTRILYKNKLFLYPVQIKDVLTKLGPIESIQSICSYIYALIRFRKMQPKSFEEWITKNFGSKLYTIFFKTYTEKVWGIPCDKIGAEWAAQRIKNLNFKEIITHALFKRKQSSAKSLVEQFYYPKKGAGYIYQKMVEKVETYGGKYYLSEKVTKIKHKNNKVFSIITDKKSYNIDTLFSSMPLTDFIMALDPLPPSNIIRSCSKLYYRDHITVNLIVNKQNLFPDNWIYVHDQSVKMARIANYNNFSKEMHKDSNRSALSVEYFVFKKDILWHMKDEKLIELAKNELNQTRLVHHKDVIDGFVVRESESYPTYYIGHKEHFDAIKKYVNKFNNVQLIGRGGMYKYNNMDHSIYSGMLAARNYIYGKNYNLWEINEEAEYLEKNK